MSPFRVFGEIGLKPNSIAQYIYPLLSDSVPN